MHLEIDVLEFVAVIFGYFSIKWFFRVFLMGLFGKVLAGLKEKATGALDNVKQSFESFEGGQQDAKNER